MSLSPAIPARRTVAAVALALAAGGSVAVAGSAHAAVCQPTANGHDAAVVATDGQTVYGPVDATGCWYGVYIGPGVTASVDQATVTNYYKAGVFVDGTGASRATGTVTNSEVDGFGNTDQVAQNGVEFWGTNASGLVRGNTIDGHSYTGTAWTATGLLLFDVNPNQIKASQNKFLNNQTNQALVSAGSCANHLGHVYSSYGLC